MKKLISIISLIFVLATGMAVADTIRGQSLGSPATLVDDSFIINNYPGALQFFPGNFFARITGLGAYELGFAFIGGDLFGVAGIYNSGTDSKNFALPGTGSGAFAGFFPAVLTSDQHVMLVSYGVKLGTMGAGLSMQNFFPQDPVINITKNSNGDVSYSETFGGLKTVIKPSVVLDLDMLKIFATVNLGLDLRQYVIKNSPGTNEIAVSPHLFDNVGVGLTAVYKLSEKSMAALKIDVNTIDDGYSISAFTQANKDAKDIHTNWSQNSFSVQLDLGYRKKVTEKATLFLDIPFGIDTTVDNGVGTGYWEATPLNSLNRRTVWTIPTVRLGGEVEVLKNLNFRLFAQPTWTSTVVEPASYDQLAAGTKTVSDAYGILTGLGLGYKIGNFAINGLLNANWFTATFQNPLNNIGELFDNAANTAILGTVQVNYYLK